ncbi:ABC transporter ATP-binding protein [Candidatus Pacearchaeota archaeon]|nr:ABC transporter ATP-binding protein [Candidatus Pacearchaeota archaeon]
MNNKKRDIGIPLLPDLSQEETGNFGLRRLLDWVWQHSKSEVVWLILAMITSAGVSSLSSISLLYASRFIDEVGRGYDKHVLMKIGITILAIFIGLTVLRLLTTTLGAFAVTNIRRNLEVDCFQHLSQLPFEYLEEKPQGRITAALMAEIPLVANVIQTVLRSFIRAPFTIVMVLAVIFYNSPLVAAVTLITMPWLFIGLSYFSSQAKKKTERSFKAISQMYRKINEHLGGIRVVRTLGLSDFYSNKMKGLSGEIAKTSRQSALLGALHHTVQELISVAILILFLVWLSWRVLNGTMDIGQALLVPAALLFIRGEVMVISGGYVRLRKTEGAAKRLRELLQVKREFTGGQRLTEPLNKISFHRVTFRYPNGKDVLEDIDLDLYPGGLTVIVGESGAGKSTICDLCLRLRTPTGGTIYYNDVEIGKLDEEFIRSSTALVEQEPYLFEEPIRNNLLLANPFASDKEIWEALTSANASEFVKTLPKGLDSEVGQRGVKLSVGQKQRIALARALIKKPQFLVLDEFTSSLDLENESEIIDALLESMPHTIILCATHRTSIIMKARDVYHLENKTLKRIDKAQGQFRIIRNTD